MSDDNQHIDNIVIPIKLKGQTAWTQKLSVARKKKALKYLLDNGYNLSKAAASVGVTRMALVKCMESDEGFRAAVEQIKDVHLDNLEETTFIVGSLPSREGHQDRKLMLQSHRRSTYGDKLQVDQTVKISQTNVTIHLDAMLDSLPNLTDRHTNSLPSSQTNAIAAQAESVQDVDYVEVKAKESVKKNSP